MAFDGTVINLFNENSVQGGEGIQVCEEEDLLFEECYYINYIDGYDEDDDDADDWSDPMKLDAALSSKPIDTEMESRIMTDEEVRRMIDNYLYNEEYGPLSMLNK